MDADLIDQIYESAVLPELWAPTLHALAEIAAARNGWLAIADGEFHLCAASNEITRNYVTPLAASGAVTQSERWRRAKALRRAGFFGEHDIYTPEELKADPFYNRYLYPVGLGWAAGTLFDLPTGETILLSLERPHASGPVESETFARLDKLRPHLGRAMLMATRLRLEAARTASATLEALGVPAVILDDHGKALAANALIEQLAIMVQWRAHDRVAFIDGAAQKLLEEAVAVIEMHEGAVRSFPLRGADGQATLVAHVLPIRLSARDIFARGAVALILTPLTAPNAPSVELLHSLFDLTPAESQVARQLAAGASIDDISLGGGVSRNTIRAQLRAVMEKTGCGRQAEVVALLAGIPSFPLNTDS